ncbi:MAG TPA: hypothetical protein VG815_08715 [Chloroflexota bacterium]|nr:hypothetical protein [Chloroflexota bacterium]
MRQDGSADHAGESRWKMGAGAAGGGTLLALGKFGLISSIFKIYWIVSLVRLASLGGWGIVIAVAGIAAIVGGSLFHFRRRLSI